jgi:hypothetical protein
MSHFKQQITHEEVENVDVTQGVYIAQGKTNFK